MESGARRTERRREQALEVENQVLREQLRTYREYDLLTGLYNKSTFYQKAEELIQAHPQAEYDIACVDVERFKLVNDIYGPDVGDDLLRYLARALTASFQPKGAVVGRMGNDVFALCLPGQYRQEAVDTILHIFQDYPMDMSVVPAIGFCPVGDRKQRMSLLCDWAVLALESVKGDYARHAAVYDSSQRSLLLEEQEMINGMEAALANREFELYMQPKCNMYTGKIIGSEALVRWRHPQKGIIPPGAFIPIFERNGFIKQLDAYVWEEAARWQRAWLDAGRQALPVSVNISRIDIYGMDVCGVLGSLLERYRLPPELLELEITESAYVNQPGEVIHTMEKLRRMGFTISMDDFGSGYSSLNMLTDINVDVLKIDMRFLERNDRKSRGILESVVHMGRWLDLPVIAEGVESQRQVDFLLGVGCVYAQGFLFYRPMPLEEYETLLKEGDKADFHSGGKLQLQPEMLLDFHELFHKDVMSDRLLGDILGAIALAVFDGKRLQLLRGTEAYYQLTGWSNRLQGQGDRDLMASIRAEDRPPLLAAMARAKERTGEGGEEVRVRQVEEKGARWLQIRVFHLAEKAEGDIYYGALSDVTEQMEAVERLRISEEQFCLAMEASSTVLFELDVETREARYSAYAQRAFGLEATVADAPEGFIQQGAVCEESHADFRAVYEAIYHGADRATCIVHANMGGRPAWNRVTLTAVKDQTGRTVKAVGMVETVSTEAEPTPGIREELERQARAREAAAPVR